MSLFSRLFGTPRAAPAVPPASTATATAPPGAPAAGAARVAADTARLAAVRQLPDGEALRAFAGLGPMNGGTAAKSTSLVVERAAHERLAALIDSGAVDFAAFCREAQDRSAMLSVALLCQDPARPAQAFATLEDPSALVQLVLHSPSSRIRQLAAERITDPAELRQTLKQVRDKDKRVYKILKQKCDALTAAERQAAQLAAETAALCASLERHSLRPHEPQYAAVLEHYTARWSSLTVPPSSDLEERAQSAIARGREVIAAHRHELERQAADSAARTADREQAERARQAEQAAAAASSHAAALLRREAAAAREAEEQARQAARAAVDQQFRQIAGLLRSANSALGDGNTQRAAGLRRAIAEKTATLALPVHLTRELQQLDEKLDELKQWKDYAVAPKRIELIEEMQSLIGLTEDPQRLAERIKALQQEWRTIGKGIVADAPDDWERFQQASRAAYEPCRIHFEAQAALRRDNLQRRQALLERLSAFAAAQQPGAAPQPDGVDGRRLATVVREASLEWRGYFPVDRGAGREIQRQFERSMARLQDLLDGWYQRNADDKRALIARARPLLAQADSREAIEAVKQLQLKWKSTGPARRDQDQSLWSEFRELCDAIFQKRQQAYDEYSAGLEASKRQAIALCDEAERLAAAPGAELLEGSAKIADWRAAFDALDEMPRSDARGLRERFERAVDGCAQRAARRRAEDAERSYTDLFEAARLSQAHAWAVADETGAADPAASRAAAESFIAGVTRWPKGGLQAIQTALANADAPPTTPLDAREASLRTLCIRCEIHGGLPTPDEDQPRRREYQVKRLMQSMGQGESADTENWDSIALQWAGSAAVTPAVYDSCRARFLRSWEARPAPKTGRST